ncbi:prosaposin isoform X2 [Pseudophryne corroboree]|uniref:prosaposin isoform X2 n=1 Tax=Pseudophryne corroboree TaxID=495146 RepID=UPI0030820E2B
MKLLVVVSCLFAAVAATPLFGTEQCANGPGVWCVNIRTASQCGAVEHCRQTVWNKPMLKSVPCDLCKEVVDVVRKFVSDNATQSEILSYLNKACEFIPDEAISSECKQLVDQYYPLVLNIIVEELNPSVACAAIGLCKSLQQHLASLKQPQQLLTNEIPEEDLSKMVYPFLANVPLLRFPQDKTTPEPKNADICKDCLQLVTDVQDSLKGNSSFCKMLIDNALRQCDQLGGVLSEECKTYINQYAQLAIQLVIQMPAQQICSGAGLCSQKKNTPLLEITPAKALVPAMKLQPAVKISQSPVAVNPMCEVCQLMVQELETLLDNNRTRENLKEALKKVCNLVPSKYRQQCDSIIDTYCDAIIELLENEVSPKQICGTLGLCSVRLHRVVALNPVHVQSGNYCSLCKMIIQYLDTILQKNATEIRIKNALEIVCNFLPDDLVAECNELVSTYEPMFIQLVLQALEPNFVCTKMDLCPNQKPLLGAEKCMWGPSYWCKDLETAANCNAIEHCKRHVWN